MESNLIVEDMLNKNPLVVFSYHTDIQSKIVRELGQDILKCWDAGIASENDFGYGKFWLWVLGAYEIIRTMDQAKKCFSQELQDKLKKIKTQIEVIRMPFAKQELQGKPSVPVGGEPSIYGIRDSPPDLSFEVRNTVISARKLIDEFDQLFGNITRGDIIAHHRTAYNPPIGSSGTT